MLVERLHVQLLHCEESHGNLTLDTLHAKFDAGTLERLDFTRNVGLPILQLSQEQYYFEAGEETGLE